MMSSQQSLLSSDAQNEKNMFATDFPVMYLSDETLESWYDTPSRVIDVFSSGKIDYAPSVNLLPELTYTASERDQKELWELLGVGKHRCY